MEGTEAVLIFELLMLTEQKYICIWKSLFTLDWDPDDFSLLINNEWLYNRGMRIKYHNYLRIATDDLFTTIL